MSVQLLGLDAGAANVKLVELKEKKGAYSLKGIAVAPMPAGCIVDGMVMKHNEAADVVKKCLEELKGHSKDCALGMRGRDVIVKRIKVPWSGTGNFQEAFLWGAEQYIGLNGSKTTYDAQLLDFDSENNIAEAVVAAAYQDKVADCVTMAGLAGLNPVVVDIEALALVNLMTMYKGLEDNVNIIIDIGHDCTNLVFYENGFVDMVKSIPKGIKALMEELMQDMDAEADTDMEKAAQLVRDKQFMSNDVDAQAVSMSFGSSLGAEIETAVDIYMSERRKEPVDYYACGAGAYMPGILEQIEIAMKVSVNRIDPFKNIKINDQQRTVIEQAGAGTFAVAVGLAMRNA